MSPLFKVAHFIFTKKREIPGHLAPFYHIRNAQTNQGESERDSPYFFT